MFRPAYTRGVTAALLDAGILKVANEELAAQMADQVAGGLPEQAVEGMTPDTTAAVANQLVELSNSLQEGAQHAAQAAEGIVGGGGGEAIPAQLPPVEAPPAPGGSEEKMASLQARAAAIAQKLAVETGSTITGDRPEQQNVPAQATQAETIVEHQKRPEEYANVGVAGVGTQADSGRGAIGEEAPNVGADGTGMGPATPGMNSPIEATHKAASLFDLLQGIAKSAMGSTITGTDPTQRNTPEQAAQVTGEGAMESKDRPQGYAAKGETGVGQSDQAAQARAAAIGSETTHPKQEAHAGGTNTAIQQSKAAEDEAYRLVFASIAQRYAGALPPELSDGEKVAAIQFLVGLTPDDREATAQHIKQAGELPEALKQYIKGKGGKKEEGKGEEKGEGKDKEENEEKEASSTDILARLRTLHQSIQPRA